MQRMDTAKPGEDMETSAEAEMIQHGFSAPFSPFIERL